MHGRSQNGIILDIHLQEQNGFINAPLLDIQLQDRMLEDLLDALFLYIIAPLLDIQLQDRMLDMFLIILLLFL